MASSNEYTVSNLVAAIQDTGMLPVSDPTATANRLIAFMNREQRTYLMRTLLSAREGYVVDHIDFLLTTGTTAFQLPTRCVAGKIKMVEVIQQGGTSVPLMPIPREMQYWYVVSGIQGGYYLEGNSIVLIQPGGSSGQVASATLRVTYFRRFGKLVQENAVGWVSGVNFGLNQVTLDTSTFAVPATFTGTQNYDLLQGVPPFDNWAIDYSASIAGNVLTFANLQTTAPNLAVGDFVCLPRQSPICQAPVEFHDLLIQRAVCKWLESAKDTTGLQTAMAVLKDMKEDVLALVAPRVEGNSYVLINYNAPGWQRGSKRRRRRLF